LTPDVAVGSGVLVSLKVVTGTGVILGEVVTTIGSCVAAVVGVAPERVGCCAASGGTAILVGAGLVTAITTNATPVTIKARPASRVI